MGKDKKQHTDNRGDYKWKVNRIFIITFMTQKT